MKSLKIIAGILIGIFSTLTVVEMVGSESGATLGGALTGYVLILLGSGWLIYSGLKTNSKKRNRDYNGEKKITTEGEKDSSVPLKKLYEKGVLSKEEYEEKLNRIHSSQKTPRGTDKENNSEKVTTPQTKSKKNYLFGILVIGLIVFGSFKIFQLKSEVKDLESNVTDYQEQIEELEKENVTLQTEIEEADSEKAYSENMNEALHERIVGLEKIIADYENPTYQNTSSYSASSTDISEYVGLS